MGAVVALVLLGSMLWVLPAGAQNGPAAKAITKMADDLAAGKTISESDIKAFVKKYDDLEDVMHAYKQGKGRPTLEQELEKLSRKTTFTTAEKAQMTKIANLSRALALVVPHYDEKTKGNAAKKKEWDRYNKDMDEGSKALLTALKAGDDKAMAKASTNLYSSCTDCHGKFR
jgi:hypothetical protein